MRIMETKHIHDLQGMIRSFLVTTVILFSACLLRGQAANDVGSVYLQKSAEYMQTNASMPFLQAMNAYQFSIFVSAGQSGMLKTNSSFIIPVTGKFFLPKTDSQGDLQYFEGFTNKSSMDAKFPSGSYTVSISTTTPNSYQDPITLGSDNYPPVPQILTITNAAWTNGALQIADVTQPVVLGWQDFQTNFGSISLGIQDANGASVLQTNIQADGSQTNCTIPANLLLNNTSYSAYLTFNLGNSTNSPEIAGASSGSGYAANTSFNIQTGTNTPQGNNELGFNLNKIINYSQSSAATPTLDPITAYQFQCTASSQSGSLLSSSTLIPPSKSKGSVNFEANSNALYFSEFFPSQATLNFAFGNGTYTLNLLTTSPGSNTFQIPFGNSPYPAIPILTKVSNAKWTGGYLIVTDPSKPVTLTWGKFKALNGSVNVNLQGSSGFNGLNTNLPAGGPSSYTIPGGSLPNDSVIQGTIGFSISEGTNSSAFLQTQNNFFLATGPTLPSPSSFSIVQKQHVLIQTNNTTPVGASGNINGDPAPYNLSVQSPYSGKLRSPNGSFPLDFTTYNSGASYSYLSPSVPSLSKLNSLYRDGSYKFPNGKSVQLTNSIYPNATIPPQITLVNGESPIWNSQGQLVLDPTIDNTLNWTSFSGTNGAFTFSNGGHEEFSMSVTGGGFSTDIQAGIGGNSSEPFNTFTLPANSLLENQTCLGVINYELTSSASTNDGITAALYSTETYFTILAQSKP